MSGLFLGLLNDMNVECRVVLVLQRFEVSEDRVLGLRSESASQEGGEIPESMRVIRKAEVAREQKKKKKKNCRHPF